MLVKVKLWTGGVAPTTALKVRLVGLTDHLGASVQYSDSATVVELPPPPMVTTPDTGPTAVQTGAVTLISADF